MKEFTVRDLTNDLKLTQEELLSHRRNIGRNLKASYKATTGSVAPKVEEDDMFVFCYPGEFKPNAEKLVGRYLKKYGIARREKRRRITGPNFQQV